jgi:hypothetical protein
MSVRFANSYIDRLFAEKDFAAIYHLISVVSKERSLPEEFWLFSRIYEWAPARSGVWQYYESLKDSDFNRISQSLDRFGLEAIAQKYREGKASWNGPTRAVDLDKWLDTHTQEIHDQIFDLIAPLKDCLRNSQ